MDMVAHLEGLNSLWDGRPIFKGIPLIKGKAVASISSKFAGV